MERAKREVKVQLELKATAIGFGICKKKEPIGEESGFDRIGILGVNFEYTNSRSWGGARGV